MIITDEERQLLVVLVTQAWVRIRDDPDMTKPREELESILRKINGVDKRIVVQDMGKLLQWIDQVMDKEDAALAHHILGKQN